MTANYEILPPKESTILEAVQRSIAKKYIDAPISALKDLDHNKIQKQVDYLTATKQRKHN